MPLSRSAEHFESPQQLLYRQLFWLVEVLHQHQRPDAESRASPPRQAAPERGPERSRRGTRINLHGHCWPCEEPGETLNTFL